MSASLTLLIYIKQYICLCDSTAFVVSRDLKTVLILYMVGWVICAAYGVSRDLKIVLILSQEAATEQTMKHSY